MHALSREVRSATRRWVRTPAIAVVCVGTLTLGIGATSALFSVMHAVLLRPLPYDGADQLVTLRSTVVAMGWSRIGVSEPLYADLTAELTVPSGVAAYQQRDITVGALAEPVRTVASYASPNLLGVLRATPRMGRFFDEAERVPGGPAVVVVSYGFWQAHLAGAPTVLGRSILIDDVPHRVIGVMGDGFRFPDARTAVWLPLRLPHDIRTLTARRGQHNLTVLARVPDARTYDNAVADVARFNRWLAERHGDFYLPKFGFSIEIARLQDELTATARPVISLLAGATALVLLVACANVANVMLIRGEARRRELAIRLALGASRRDLLLAVVAENVTLAVASAVCGTALGHALVRLAITTYGSAIPRADEIGLSWAAVAFALVAAIVAAGLVALLPAVRLIRVHPSSVLREETRGGTASGARARVRTGLVVSEVALSFVLLVGTALALRSLRNALDVEPGFVPTSASYLELSLPPLRYDSAERTSAFFEELARRVRGVPGVSAVGAIDRLPLVDPVDDAAYVAATQWPARGSAEVAPSALRHVVTPGFFEAAGVSLDRGRYLNDNDRRDALPVAVINAALARRHWPGADAIGRQIFLFGDKPRTIVGVVAAVRSRALTAQAEPEIYVPAAQWSPRSTMKLVVRSATPATSLGSGVREVVRAIDPALPVGRFTPLGEVVSVSLSRPRFLAVLITAFGSMALLIGAVGVYGTLAYSFALRRRELAVRTALGASPTQLRGLVLSAGLGIVSAGLAVGVPVSLMLATGARAAFYGVQPNDLTSYAAAALVLVVVGAVASSLPARRASRLDPLEALRAE